MRNIATSFLFIILLACSATLPKKQNINGVSFVASRESIDQSHVKPLLNIHANYAAVMPFAFIRDLSSPEVIYNTDRQWYGETKAGVIQYIEQLKSNNIKIMLKPQIWIWRGEFTGNLDMQSEEDWKVFEDSYSKFILEFAQVAENTNSELFCIGTELNRFISSRPQYWIQLIKEVRSVYKGKLTYAENWDSYNKVPFWDALDYIGVDAYFPLSEERMPTEENLIKGWQLHKMKLELLSKEINKQILFTEYGYRSVDYTAKEPWNSGRNNEPVNLGAQSVALKVLYEQFWNEDWFAGGFLWKWYHDHDKGGGENNDRFTPQNKPAESIVKTFYLNN